MYSSIELDKMLSTTNNYLCYKHLHSPLTIIQKADCTSMNRKNILKYNNNLQFFMKFEIIVMKSFQYLSKDEF